MEPTNVKPTASNQHHCTKKNRKKSKRSSPPPSPHSSSSTTTENSTSLTETGKVVLHKAACENKKDMVIDPKTLVKELSLSSTTTTTTISLTAVRDLLEEDPAVVSPVKNCEENDLDGVSSPTGNALQEEVADAATTIEISTSTTPTTKNAQKKKKKTSRWNSCKNRSKNKKSPTPSPTHDHTTPSKCSKTINET